MMKMGHFSLFPSQGNTMDLYDLLAGVGNTPAANKVLTKEEVLAREPTDENKKVLSVSGGIPWTFRNNDARLVIENIKHCPVRWGACASHVKAEGFLFDESGKITGVVARVISLTDQVFEIKARLVINTTGPWSDKVRNLKRWWAAFTNASNQGVHLVVDSSKIKGFSNQSTSILVLETVVWSRSCHVKTKLTSERLTRTTLVT